MDLPGVRLLRTLVSLAVLMLVVAGCAARAPYADDAQIAAVSYTSPEPPSITVYTMINNRSGAGGHSALLINASERIMFDPAGSFELDIVPERNDVLFGFTPRIEKAYRSAHARSTYHVLIQRIPVSAEQAEIAYRLALANGAVAPAFCTQANSNLLRKVPGFENIRPTFFPVKLADQIAEMPGVVSERYYENDAGDITDGVAAAQAAIRLQ